MLVENYKSQYKRYDRNCESIEEMMPVPHRAVKNAGTEHFKNTVQRIQHQNLHYDGVDAASVKSFEAVHDRCNIKEHERYNAVNILDILEINIENREYQADAGAENAKEDYRHKAQKNIPRKMQVGIRMGEMILDEEITHYYYQNQQ